MASTCGCGSSKAGNDHSIESADRQWIQGTTASAIGPVPRLSTQLTWQDRVGAWRVRWKIGRMSYAVPPGLYAIGCPTPESPVFVTANYKLTLDALRRELTGIATWILVLDTKGINVWCAAGKGTFGTNELVARIAATRLAEVVSHRRVIVPQLGAPGISGHTVAKQSGFSVEWGPVRAHDLPNYLANGHQATSEMRRVRFTLRDRLAVVPVEIVSAWQILLGIAVFLVLLATIGREHALLRAAHEGLAFAGALIAGTVLTPALLPWLPFRAFTLKGLILGFAWTLLYFWMFPAPALETTAGFLLLPAFSAFLAMNFTGSTTFTSPTGALREVRIGTPIIAVVALAGIVLKLIALGKAIF